MDLADIFLVFGEKCDELRAAGFAPFFQYSGHVDYYSFYVHPAPWSSGSDRVLEFDSSEFDSMGEFMQACLNSSNLLMHK